ncbi:MAG: hypothetical protein IPG24_17185 [Leptospiraceae bacterium]|nr:hypothetical protein [Leptospiraceae bacterium]
MWKQRICIRFRTKGRARSILPERIKLKTKGETDNHALDRLTTVNSIERQRLIEESKAAQKRAQELREAIARQEAEEAASKWNRE